MTTLATLLAPLIIALLVVIFIGFSKIKTDSNKVLMWYFLLFSFTLFFMLIVSYSVKHNIQNKLINLSSLLFYVVLLAIPSTFYLYVTSLSDISEIKNKTPHYYIPTALLVINCLAFVYLSYGNDTNSFIFTTAENVMNYTNFIALLFIYPLLNIFYIYNSISIYLKHKKEINNVFSYNEGINLKWMQHYIIGYVFFIICVYSIQLDIFSTNIKIPISIFMTIYLAYIGYKGINQLKITFSDNDNQEEESIIIESTNSTNKILKQDIIAIMEQESLYLKTDLTIHQLSKKVNSNSKSVSYLLNNEFNKNFVTFVNEYRIQKAKFLLANPEFKNYTIEAISQEVGFNSKSAFNRAFKQITEVTPSQYKLKNGS